MPPSEYADVLASLYRLEAAKGMDFKLERVALALKNLGDPQQRFTDRPDLSDEHLPRRLVVRAEKHQYEADDEDRVEQRKGKDEWGGQTAISRPHSNAESAHHQDQQDLRRETGADDDFDQRVYALDRQHPPAFGNERRLRDRLQHRLNCNKLKVKS